MYHFETTNNDIYEQGVDEGRRQVLADVARIVKAASGVFSLEEDIKEYLTQEGYL